LLFAAWRVQSGPVSLDFAAPALRAALNAAWTSGAVRQIDGVVLSRNDPEGGYRLTIDGVLIGERGAAATARVPRIEATFHPGDLLQGRAGPRRLLIEGAQVRIIRRKDRRMKLDLGESGANRVQSFRALTGGAYFRDAFERAELRDASISFVDEASGRQWVGRRAAAAIVRSEAGYAASMSGEFDLGARTSDLDFKADYDIARDEISAHVALERAPVGDLVAIFFNQQTDFLTSLVTGRASVRLKGDGEVISSSLDGFAEGGHLRIGAVSSPVERIDVAAHFDPAANAFAIRNVAWKTEALSGRIAGAASIEQSRTGVDAVNFDIAGGAAAINLPATFDQPIEIAEFNARGRYVRETKTLSLEAVRANVSGAQLKGEATVSMAASTRIKGRIGVDGALSGQTLLRIWPIPVARGAREFTAERISGARFDKVDISADFDSAAVSADGALPNEALAISFDVNDATLIIAPGMTPLRKVVGKGRVSGNAFAFDLATADLGALKVTKGGVSIPRLAPKGAMARYFFDARGDASDMLGILNEPPLSLLKDSGLSPTQFAGSAVARVEIGRPNLRLVEPDDYVYGGAATFTDLDVENLFGDISVDDANGRLSLTTQGLKLFANARAGTTPVEIEWTQRFKGAEDRSLIILKGVADSSTGDLFSIPTRRLVQGPVGFVATIRGDLGKFRRVDVDADFSKSLLIADQFGWAKPRDTDADGRFSVIWSADGSRDIAASVLGAGIDLRGRALMAPDGSIIQAFADSLKLVGAADATIDAQRDANGVMTVDIKGSYLNAAPMIEKFLDQGFGPGGGGESQYAVTAKIENVQMRSGATFEDASIDFRKKGARYSTFNFIATDEKGRAVTVALDDGAGSGVQTVIAKSQDIGALLQGVFAVSSIKGGSGVLQFDVLPGQSAAAHGPDGTLSARGLRVVNAPLLAKVLGASSLTGLADILNGEGIELETAYARFSLDKGRMRIREARAAGPSLGITAGGEVDLAGNGRVALSGAVAPAYGINSFLGNTPLIGDLFISRRGEGLIAVSYDVDGSIAEPRVTVNPLSALAPGVLRRMFDDSRPPAAAPSE